MCSKRSLNLPYKTYRTDFMAMRTSFKETPRKGTGWPIGDLFGSGFVFLFGYFCVPKVHTRCLGFRTFLQTRSTTKRVPVNTPYRKFYPSPSWTDSWGLIVLPPGNRKDKWWMGRGRGGGEVCNGPYVAWGHSQTSGDIDAGRRGWWMVQWRVQTTVVYLSSPLN